MDEQYCFICQQSNVGHTTKDCPQGTIQILRNQDFDLLGPHSPCQSLLPNELSKYYTMVAIEKFTSAIL